MTITTGLLRLSDSSILPPCHTFLRPSTPGIIKSKLHIKRLHRSFRIWIRNIWRPKYRQVRQISWSVHLLVSGQMFFQNSLKSLYYQKFSKELVIPYKSELDNRLLIKNKVSSHYKSTEICRRKILEQRIELPLFTFYSFSIKIILWRNTLFSSYVTVEQ